MNELTVVVLNYNTKKLTIDCLNSIFNNDFKTEINVVVVDNASTDDSVKQIRENFKNVDLIESKKNLGFAGGNNIALKKYHKTSKYLLLLNSDTLVQKKSLDNLITFAQKYDFAIESCRLLNPDGSFQPNAGELPSPLYVFFWLSGLDDVFRKFIRLPSYQERGSSYYKNNRSVGWVSGSVMLIDCNLIKEIGFLDEKIFMYGEDVDYCWRAKRAGFKIGWTDEAEIVHIGGASVKTPEYNQWLGEFRGLLYLYKKYYGKVPMRILKLLMYFFIFLRACAFYLIGKPLYAKNYIKILRNL
jgi:GT2 family glycosyltransferase